MSEVNSPSSSRISKVAHFFLTDLRKEESLNEKSEQKTVKRVAPVSDYSYPPPQQQTDQSEKTDPSDFMSLAEEKTLSDSEKSPQAGLNSELNVIAVYCSHLRWDGNKYLSQFARTLASLSDGPVAVLKLEAWSVNLRLYRKKSDQTETGEYQTGLPSEDYGEDELNTDFDGIAQQSIARQLEKIGPKLSCLLLCWGPEYAHLEDRLIGLADQSCVIATPDREKMISSYQVLKGLSSNPNHKTVGVFLADVENFLQAQSVYGKLSQTIKSFSGKSIENFGYVISEGLILQELLARTDIQNDSQDWIDGLESWINTLKVMNPKSAESSEAAVSSSENKSEDNTQKPVETSAASTAPKPDKNDDLLMIEMTDPMDIRDLAERLFEGGTVEADPLDRFLQSAGVRCQKIKLSDQSTVLMILMLSEDDLQLIGWTLENYPQTEQSIQIITDRELNSLETSRYRKKFPNLTYRYILRGTFNQKDVMLLKR